MKAKRIITPLSSTFMLTSIVGFMVSAFFVPSMSDGALPYGIAFSLVFILMFIASLISMNNAPAVDFLHIEEKRRPRF